MFGYQDTMSILIVWIAGRIPVKPTDIDQQKQEVIVIYY